MPIPESVSSGLIEAQELQQLITAKTPNIKIIDASLPAPGSTNNMRDTYTGAHIKGAQFFDIKAISDQSTDLPNMLPTAAAFADYVSDFGISNDDLIIIYGQTGMIMGPARAWWMFKIFGHDRVCLLNGGLLSWNVENLPITDSITTPQKSNYSAAAYNVDMLVNKDQVLQASETHSAFIFDARAAERFNGELEEPRPGLRAGHIPGARNLPCSQLVDPETGALKDRASIKQFFTTLGLDAETPVITSCGSGITACVLAFGLHYIHHKNIAVYDGSWAEWGDKELGLPIQTRK